MNVKISVIIPVYNSSLHLNQCLNSLLNQTFKDIEIICVYDISKDNSLKILEEYAQKDKRVIVINLGKNSIRGAGNARNTGLHRAKGEYIHFVDSDDWVEPHIYEELWSSSHNAGNADLVSFTKYYKNYKEKQIIEKHIPLEIFQRSREDLNKYICKNLSSPTWMIFVKKQLIFDNNLFFAQITHEDIPIAHALYCSAKKIFVVDISLYHYRFSKNSISFITTDKRFDLLLACIMYLENMKRLGFYNLYREECDYWFYTRYYCRMIDTCLSAFPKIRKDYIEKIKSEFPKYVNIHNNKYYITRKKSKFDLFLWILDKNTNLACLLYNILKYSQIINLLKYLKEKRRYFIYRG
jgi:glycosyltransferase involved in cell wall biosynthesis